MALYEYGNAQQKAGTRSHTNLIKSPGDAPGGNWIIDNSLAGLFSYQYAVGRRLSKVVVPKGTLVAVSGKAKDYLTRKYRNIITVANGVNNAIGVAPYNYFNRFKNDGTVDHDRFGADDFQPGIITREYIEVPYLPNPVDVFGDGITDGVVAASGAGMATMAQLKMMWGCATNMDRAAVNTATELQAGDYVKAGPCGKFVKWVKGTDDACLIVGHCLELDVDMPPLGWLQYIEQVFEGRYSDREPFTPEPAPIEGQVYDPDYTYPWTQDYMRPDAAHASWKTIGNGQPGLTDGVNIAKTYRIGRASLAEGESTVDVDLDPIVRVDATTITVKIEGVSVNKAGATPAAPYWTYDEETQIVTVVDSGTSGARGVEVIYKVDPKTMIGVPASWDYAGSIGVARILLKF